MALSKRHQARNEKALQDLIRSVPGNDRCADCEARNPGWASWNLGVFICMRCAAIHRKLGTHISKVKSLSMDSWSSDQVGTMKLQGNENSNNFFNPKKIKPEVPIDVDEVDAAMERFIRRKYVSKDFLLGKGLDVYKARVGFTSQPSALGISGESKPRKLSEDRGPPPPPKTGRLFKFGLRSSSSAVGLSRKNQEAAAAMESPPERKSSKGSKQRVYGAAINVSDSVKGLEFKMTSLKDMGFLNEDQNLAMLMSKHGDVSRAAEALSTQPASSNNARPGPIAATRSPTMPATLPKPAEQVPQRSATLPVSNSQAFNTNAEASQQAQSFEDSFANLNVSQPLYQQPTGYSAGYYQAPAMPSVPQQYTGAGSQSSNPYMSAMPASPMHNPFMNNATQPMSQYQPQLVNQTAPSSMNPFFQQMQQPVPQQTYAAQPSYGSQPSWYDSPVAAPVSQPAQTGNMHNPFFNNQQASFIQEPASFVATPPALPVQQMPSPGYSYAGQQAANPYAAAPLYPQPTGRLDKNSIMALYNYPQLAPQPAPTSISPIGSPSAVPTNLAPSQNPQRSFTMPVTMPPATNTRNPFAVNRKPSGAPVASAVAGNGRSSPDAFADLSSRFVR